MTYDIVQTTFLLSMAANKASGSPADNQATLQQRLETYLNGDKTQDGFFTQMNPYLVGGDWKAVWGPCVYGPSGEAVNAMFVAHSDKLATYVVAIAGTNFESLSDWEKQDDDVDPEFMVEWSQYKPPFEKKKHPAWPTPPPPAISAATAQGVSNLMTQLNDRSGVSIDKYLSSVVNNKGDKETLIFCGHSLGGALAPTLALYLYPEPSKSGWKKVLVLPTAGASPGNQQFAALFNNAYPRVSEVNTLYGSWNTDYANECDVVPHAWNQLNGVITGTTEKNNYNSIYGVMSKDLGKCLLRKIESIEGKVKDGGYMNLNQTPFQPEWGHWRRNLTGQIERPPQWEKSRTYTDSNPMRTDELYAVLRNGHIDQYQRFFKVEPLPLLRPKPRASSSES
jgi:hypothetical protein